VVFDMKYCTNKYDMICPPFVDMNHHAMSVMFGCEFFMNEMIDSFIQLFKTFLKSIDNKHPITMMTNQAFSMAVAIKIVFPLACHRLCCLHIIENPRKHIGALRTGEGPIKMLNRALMQCIQMMSLKKYGQSMNLRSTFFGVGWFLFILCVVVVHCIYESYSLSSV